MLYVTFDDKIWFTGEFFKVNVVLVIIWSITKLLFRLYLAINTIAAGVLLTPPLLPPTNIVY
jgi:hypothetical protein